MSINTYRYYWKRLDEVLEAADKLTPRMIYPHEVRKIAYDFPTVVKEKQEEWIDEADRSGGSSKEAKKLWKEYKEACEKNAAKREYFAPTYEALESYRYFMDRVENELNKKGVFQRIKSHFLKS